MTIEEAYRHIKASYIHHSRERNAVFLPQAEEIALKLMESIINGDYISKYESVDETYLTDWYISSVSEDDIPVWTEEHISELYNDFYIIPKDTNPIKG